MTRIVLLPARLAVLLLMLLSAAAAPAAAAPARGVVGSTGPPVPAADRAGGVITAPPAGWSRPGRADGAAARSDRDAAGTDGARYEWPTGGRVPVQRAFDPPEAVWGEGHRGVDLALPAGSRVLASADGVVAFAGVVVDRPVVSIDHVDGIRTTYEPVRPTVAAGDVVSSGDVIGYLRPGHCRPPDGCLHFGARTGPDNYLDPLTLLGAEVVIRLFPT